MRAAIYARVSTTDQTCDLQLRELRQYISARGWQVAGEYVDTGWSGAAAARPELDRLLADARLPQNRCRGCVEARPLGPERCCVYQRQRH
jgi:DNA invertase Pin-like site-specific DNA recombinase